MKSVICSLAWSSTLVVRMRGTKVLSVNLKCYSYLYSIVGLDLPNLRLNFIFIKLIIKTTFIYLIIDSTLTLVYDLVLDKVK